MLFWQLNMHLFVRIALLNACSTSKCRSSVFFTAAIASVIGVLAAVGVGEHVSG